MNLAINYPKMRESTTPIDSNPPTPEQFNEVAYLEDELKETKLALEWAHQHIRRLKVLRRSLFFACNSCVDYNILNSMKKFL